LYIQTSATMYDPTGACLAEACNIFHARGYSVMHYCILCQGILCTVPVKGYRYSTLYPDTKYIACFGWTGSQWIIYCGRCLYIQPRQYKQLQIFTRRGWLLYCYYSNMD